ncbi:thioredoxin family protein [Flavobacterium agricola]|uniref:Thioredoxin family protein n=1 Tax=Flavobacterium agricola TaxID=2870839 RepID=A0ABY6M2G6_9FLAO|nr:thioredoxin family protein [Flavobacterium agricola]UYW01326.1 thioredoxin family protein [Flavobacterium agricola]
MKLKFFIVFLGLLVQTSFAQTANWYEDAHQAVAASNKANKPLLIFFTGSDWCGWCKRLQKEVFNTQEFKTWADKNVVLLELDFPRKNNQPKNIQIQNQQIQAAFSIQGYPTVWIVTPEVNDGKTNFVPLGRTGYEAGGVSKWLLTANSILKNK